MIVLLPCLPHEYKAAVSYMFSSSFIYETVTLRKVNIQVSVNILNNLTWVVMLNVMMNCKNSKQYTWLHVELGIDLVCKRGWTKHTVNIFLSNYFENLKLRDQWPQILPKEGWNVLKKSVIFNLPSSFVRIWETLAMKVRTTFQS